MEERIRAHHEDFGAPGGLGDPFAQDATSGSVTVSHGPYCEALPVGGRTVGEIRARFGDRFDIDPRSQAILDGTEVGDDAVVRQGQNLMFAHRAGEKGR